MNTVRVTVNVVHRGETFSTDVCQGERFADALKKIGYWPQGHDSWRLWRNGHPISFDASVRGTTTVTMTHVAMGEHPGVD